MHCVLFDDDARPDLREQVLLGRKTSAALHQCNQEVEGPRRNRDGRPTRQQAAHFYNFNRPGVKVDHGVILNWWRQGMTGGAKSHYDGIKAFSETDFTEDVKAINVPTLVMQGDDDQVLSYENASLLTIKLLKKGTLKIYKGYPHGMCTTHADVMNPDLLAFIKS